MSAICQGWVWENSPYTGSLFLIHVAIGDLANEQNENLLWMSQSFLAKKTRLARKTVNMALQRMVDDGMLQLVKKGGTGGFETNTYRFLMPDTNLIQTNDETNTEKEMGVTTGNTETNIGVTTGNTDREIGVTSTEMGVTTGYTNSIELKVDITQEDNNNSTQLFLPDLNSNKDNSKSEEKYPKAFEEAWKIYPRRIAKHKAVTSWKQAVSSGHDPRALLLATQNYAKECKDSGKEEKFILHASSFYHPKNKRFLDYVNVDVNDTIDEEDSLEGLIDPNELFGDLLDE